MSPETQINVIEPPEIVCACPPSHRWLRLILSLVVAILVLALVGCLTYLRLTGGQS